VLGEGWLWRLVLVGFFGGVEEELEEALGGFHFGADLRVAAL
jgi:hypothetical protein